MIERPHAFGEQAYSLLDNVIFTLRKRQVLRALPNLRTQHLADFGSGYDARLLCGLMRQFNELEGTAFDIAFMDPLHQIPRLHLVVGDLNVPLPAADNSFEIGLSLAVLEHLDQPQHFLNEAYRTLKPGGRMVLTTPGPKSRPLLEFLAFRLRIIDAAEISDHKNYFSSNDLQAMFAKAGFDPAKIKARTFIFGMNNVVIADK